MEIKYIVEIESTADYFYILDSELVYEDLYSDIIRYMGFLDRSVVVGDIEERNGSFSLNGRYYDYKLSPLLYVKDKYFKLEEKIIE